MWSKNPSILKAERLSGSLMKFFSYLLILSFILHGSQLFAQKPLAQSIFDCTVERGDVDLLEVTEGDIHIVTLPLHNLHLQGASIVVQIAEASADDYLLTGVGGFHFSVSVFDKKIQLRDKRGHISEGDSVTFDFDKDKREIMIYATDLLSKYEKKFVVKVHFVTAGFGDNGEVVNDIQVKCDNLR